MTITYLLGNLVGRALISFALIWLGCWIASRFEWRRALRLSTRWYCLLGVAALTLLGLGSAMSRGGL